MSTNKLPLTSANRTTAQVKLIRTIRTVQATILCSWRIKKDLAMLKVKLGRKAQMKNMKLGARLQLTQHLLILVVTLSRELLISLTSQAKHLIRISWIRPNSMQQWVRSRLKTAVSTTGTINYLLLLQTQSLIQEGPKVSLHLEFKQPKQNWNQIWFILQLKFRTWIRLLSTYHISSQAVCSQHLILPK